MAHKLERAAKFYGVKVSSDVFLINEESAVVFADALMGEIACVIRDRFTDQVKAWLEDYSSSAKEEGFDKILERLDGWECVPRVVINNGKLKFADGHPMSGIDVFDFNDDKHNNILTKEFKRIIRRRNEKKRF